MRCYALPFARTSSDNVKQLCFIGHVIVASAQSNQQIIAGLAVSGFGGANCQVCSLHIPPPGIDEYSQF